MIRSALATLAISAVCLLTGCASQSYAVLLPSPDGTVGAILVSTDKGSVLINKKQQAASLDGTTSTPYDVSNSKVQKDFGPALSAQPQLPAYFQVYFKFGGDSLTPESDAFIPSVLATIRERGICTVSVIGHTDTAGDQESNERLALMRAKSVAQLLKKSGLKALDLTVSSHGERNPLVKTRDDTPEPKNRRVEIIVR